MGFSLRPLGRRITDIFDANSAQDQAKRVAAGQPQMYADQQAAPVAAPVNRSFASRAFDQINPLDSGRTFANSVPTSNRNTFGQIAHNGITNTIGNMGVKPLVLNPLQIAAETGRMVAADVTSNPAAQRASQMRQMNNFKGSIPGQIYTAGYKIGSVPGDLMAATISDAQGKHDLANISRDSALRSLNETPGVSAVTQPFARAAANFKAVRNHDTVKGLEDIGVDPNASFGKQVTDTALSASALYMLAHGMDTGSTVRPQVGFKDTIKSVISPKNEGGFVQRGRTPTAIHPEDLGTMSDFVDKARGVYRPNAQTAQQLELDAARIAERYGIKMKSGKTPQQTVTNLANEFEKHLYAADHPREIYNPITKQFIPDPSLVGNEGGFAKIAKDGKVPDKSVTSEALKPKEKALLARVAFKEATDKAAIADAQKTVDRITQKAFAEGNRQLTTAEDIKYSLAMEKLTGVKPTRPDGTPITEPTKAFIKNPLNLPEANTQSMPTPLGKSKYGMSSSGLLDNSGIAGKEFNRRFDIVRSTREQLDAAFWKSVPSVKTLGNETTAFVDALEALSKGETPTMSPKVTQAVKEYSQAMPKIRDTAVAAGKEVGDRGPYYFPRDYSKAFEPKNLNKTVQHLIDTKQATDVADAMQKIDFMKQNSKPIYGHLDKTRSFDLPGYNKSMDALSNYVSAAHDNIAKAEQFGPKHEIIDQLVNHMSKEGYDTRIAKDAIDVSMDNKTYNPTTSKWFARERQFQGMTKLGKAGVTNAGQSANTAITEGAINTLRSVKQLRDKNVLGLIEDSGVLNDHTISKIASGSQGTTNVVATNLASPGFTQVERFNRMVAGQAGKNSADILAKKAFAGDVTAELKLRSKYGITGDIRETLTREQQIQAIRKTVEKTQFKVDGFDLPPWANSPIGKSATQFKPFMYKQTKFLMDEVIKAAKNDKDLMPMVRMLTVGAPIGVAGMYVKGAIAGYNPFVDQKTKEQDSTLTKLAKGVNAVGGTGMASIPIDLYNKRASDSLTSRVAGTIGGPGSSDVVDTSQNIIAGNKNKDWKPLERQILTKIPVVGNRISNAVAPYSEQPSSTPNKGETATPAQLDDQSTKQLKQMKLDVKAGDNALVQLPNGKYALTMNGEVTTKKTLEEARNAARLDHALADGSTSKVLGDKHYYKNEAGDTKAEPLYKYEYDKVNAQTSLDMYVAKDNEDYKGWTTAADTKMKALVKKRDGYNKDGQEDEVNKTQKEIEQLKHDMNKYASYGGSFTKGKNGSGIHPGSYHVSLNAGGSAPRVTSKTQVAALRSVSFAGAGTKPRVSSAKSRV